MRLDILDRPVYSYPMSTAKEALVAAGTELFLRRSYQGTGISEILEVAGVAKGSFYHHFPSKEHLALAVVEAHKRDRRADAQATLENTGLPHLERIRKFLQVMVERVVASGFSQGCALGTFGQEMAASSEPLRVAVGEAFAAGRAALCRCIAEGQTAGSIRRDLHPEHAARYVISALHGAVIMAKVERSARPLELAIELSVDVFLPAPGSGQDRSAR